MNRKGLKWELSHLKKAFLAYHQGWRYIFNKFFIAKKIIREKFSYASNAESNLSIHVLVCQRDFIMLLWSLKSFFSFFNYPFQLYLHNDGTLSLKQINILKKYFPKAICVEPTEILNNKNLTAYPVIKNFLLTHPNYYLMKKIVDSYFISEKNNILVIDSDLLWFKAPEELLNNLNNNCDKSLMMWSPLPGPVYFKDGTVLDENLSHYNSGIVLYQRANFNLVKLSEYLEKIDTDNPTNFQFIEEAGFTQCLKNLQLLPKEKYIIKGKVDEQIVARHYTSPRRPGFYLEGLSILIKNKP
ncbi:MAG TPA: hypothetical protein PLF15_00785 [bacterium]|nr:hypothetical protein [bacterium]